jgi:hypothetical protein
MAGVSYSAHISNAKSAITTKNRLAGVAKHNLRKYKSSDYSASQVILLCGSENLMQDVKDVYRREFDAALREYNEKQTREDRKIKDYFEHVAEAENQDIAVEIIFQCGDKAFWEQHENDRDKVCYVYRYTLSILQKLLPDFKVANAVIHFDEASPHMHVVGVPVWEGGKRGIRKKVSKRNVFTPEVLSIVLQDRLREEAGRCFKFHYNEQIGEKRQGRNHDLTVAEYKVQKETEKLDRVSADVERERNNLYELELDSRFLKQEIENLDRKKENRSRQIQIESEKYEGQITRKQEELISVNGELDKKEQELKEMTMIIGRFRQFTDTFRLFAPTIEEYANHVEKGERIEAGNSFRGILYELGKLLMSFKELLQEGLCWFPRLMRWKTSVGEVAPVFLERSSGYDYEICGYMNVETKVRYTKSELQQEIKADRRTGTIEQMDANLVALEKDIAEVLRVSREQKRLWEAYEDWKVKR